MYSGFFSPSEVVRKKQTVLLVKTIDTAILKTNPFYATSYQGKIKINQMKTQQKNDCSADGVTGACPFLN